MAFDELFAGRVRDEIIGHRHYSERKMFGCAVFMLHGKMACAVTGGDLIVRVGKDKYQECLAMENTRTFGAGDKVMKGWVIVDGSILTSRDALLEWINKGVSFCLSLTPNYYK